MITLTEFLTTASGPVLGALIGWLTNGLAVRMLFRPYTEKTIFGKRLPFTPGILPKRKDELARAVGEAVAGNLLTAGDLTGLLTSPELRESLSAHLLDTLLPDNGETAAEAFGRLLPEASLDDCLNDAAVFLTEALVTAAEERDFPSFAAELAGELLSERRSSLGWLSFLLSENRMNALTDGIREQVRLWLTESARERLLPVVREELESLSARTTAELAESLPFDREELRRLLERLLERLLGGAAESLIHSVDIAGIVESKIRSMDAAELEALCLSVMKKELGALVNLGAVIGFLMGLISLLL